jgi:hypothetical protein
MADSVKVKIGFMIHSTQLVEYSQFFCKPEQVREETIFAGDWLTG